MLISYRVIFSECAYSRVIFGTRTVRQNIIGIEQDRPSSREAFHEKITELRGIITQAVDLLAQLEQQTTPVLLICEANGYVRLGVNEVTLSPSEMTILLKLAARKDVVPRDDLLEALYPDRSSDGASSLYVMLSSLRRKLRGLTNGENPIDTLKGRGFRLKRDVLRPEVVPTVQ